MKLSSLSNVFFRIGCLLACVALVTACTSLKTSPRRQSEESSGATNASGTESLPSSTAVSGLLLGFEFRGAKGPAKIERCRLRIVNQKTRQGTYLDLDSKKGGLFEPLAPGFYETSRLGCGLSRVWNLQDLFAKRVQVVPGKVSYLGKINFDFLDGDLKVVAKGERVESAQALKSLLQQWPDVHSSSLVSAFTTKPITSEMIDGEFREGFDLFALGTRNPSHVLNPLLSELKNCGTEAAKSDPLRFGQLHYIAIYKQGNFGEFRKKENTSALSDDFLSCIEASLRGFHPREAPDLQLRVRL